MKKVFTLAIGYAANSIFPIIAWIIWGVIVDKDINTVFSLTYPLQFVWVVLIDIFGYGIFTYAAKRKDTESENYMQTGLFIGTVAYIMIFVVLAIFNMKYIRVMGFNDSKYSVPCIFSLITYATCGVVTLCSMYYSFKDNSKAGSKVLLIYNISVYVTLVASLVITKSSVISTVISLTCAVMITITTFVRVIKPFKFKIDLKRSVYCVASDLVSDIALFIIYFFGIGNVAENDIKVIITLSVCSQMTDWVWDVLSNTIPVITRVESVKGRYNFKSVAKRASVLMLTLFVIIAGEALVMINLFDISMKYFIIYLSLDLLDMVLYIPRRILESNLSTTEHSGKTAICGTISYSLRIALTLALPVKVALYIAQLASGTVKLILLMIINKHSNKTKGNRKILKEAV